MVKCIWQDMRLIHDLCFKLGWLNFLIILSVAAEPLKFEIKGEAAILMNAQSGDILFEYRAFDPHFPASTTKIATALYALKIGKEKLDLPIVAEQDCLVSITQEAKRKSNYTLPAHWLEPDGTHIGLKKGEILSLHALLQGMLIASGNDAANVIAQYLGPTIPTFIEGMNAYLKEIGCKNTHFCNVHGLHDPQHQSTAYDLALMTQEALKHPLFCEIVAQPRFLRPKTNKQGAITLLQTNRLLRPGKFYYSKAIGVKTGYHAKAKKNLVGAARADGRVLIVVLLGYQDRNAIFEDAIQLFETAFNQPKIQRVLLQAGTQAFKIDLPKANAPVQTYLAKPLILEYYPAEDPQVKCLLYWRQPLSLPILKDQPVGDLRVVSAKGQLLQEMPLLAAQEVRLIWPYNWLAALPSLPWLFIVVGGLVGIAGLELIRKI
jgi:D-alanyl-D-alanine carboxypeptidase (penicillin-binding protein 5/6)